MINPRIIEIIKESSTYKLPTFIITNDGILDGQGLEIKLCKGNKEDENIFRQEGLFTESILQLCVEYLQSVNVGELANRDTSLTITHIEDAILRLGKRSQDRQLRNVLGTYKK